jgi:hypothetical protein
MYIFLFLQVLFSHHVESMRMVVGSISRDVLCSVVGGLFMGVARSRVGNR